jgi:hypothetical protein
MDLKINRKDIMQHLTVRVHIPRSFLLRTKLGLWVMKLGASIVGCGVAVESDG